MLKPLMVAELTCKCGLRWYSYLNFIRFSWGAVMVNQFQGQTAEFLPGYTVKAYAAQHTKYLQLACVSD